MTAMHPTPSNSPARRRGLTLMELLVSATIMAVLLGGMASAIAVASRALPSAAARANVTQNQAAINTALDQIHADLLCAKTITALSANSITVTVADRGHGTAGDETIRYAWSGVAGQPLTREYNGGASQTLATGVTTFTLAGTIGAGVLRNAPRVALIVGNSGSLSTHDTARKALLDLWLFPVTLVDDGDPAATFTAAAASNDVVWYSEQIWGPTLYGKLPNPSVGVVIEQNTLFNEFGISYIVGQFSGQNFDLTSNTHEITRPFTMGSFNLFVSSTPGQTLNYASGTLAPGAVALGQQLTFTNRPMIMALEAGGLTWNSVVARSRRVTMPWGGSFLNPLAFASLSPESKQLLKRALVWAAAPSVYTRMRVTLKAGTAPQAERLIDLLNQPGVSKP